MIPRAPAPASAGSPRERPDHARLRAAVLCSGLVFFAVIGADALASAEPPPVPEEAFTACSGKSEGDACTAKLPDRELAGTCTQHPKEGKLFCRPSGPPPSGGPRADTSRTDAPTTR
jgi:hypothetical protein